MSVGAETPLPAPGYSFREAYRELGRYGGGADVRLAVDLSDNTNLWGAPPGAVRTIAYGAGGVARYPHAYATSLAGALADHAGVTPDMIVTGCGSDDVLDAAMRAFADPGATVAMPDPTFPMAATAARMNGLTPVAVSVTAAWQMDLEPMLETGARIIYVASPSNPIGVAEAIHALESLVDRAPGFVIIDSAYAEFGGMRTATIDRLVHRSDRVLVVHTMSKAWGLAGLRIGYAIGAPRLVAEVEKARGPYKVGLLSERAATAALREDRQWVATRVAEAIANRDRLADALPALGLHPLPSDANFLLVPVGGIPGGAAAVTAALRAREVGVRSYPGLRRIGDAVRITVGPWSAMARLLDALSEMLPALRAGT